MTEAELQELQSLADAATPGPWLCVPDARGYANAPNMVWTNRGPGFGTVALTCPTGLASVPQQAADAAFIAASRDGMTALIAEVRRLQLLLLEGKDHAQRT